ncbi:camphor resistance protein CrcB [Paraoerskovia marina]|uniref:Fluoride-specific ion channel FluC n=1 Tax=Paraoerskovia marina TaxID=545619 RepID=A0A1H1MAF1_9CELL|nr:CrcB family protein [Paraoerskovia marina]SDR82969.1 camphor resistance protein CrcB [Paraoerskovia marina]
MSTASSPRPPYATGSLIALVALGGAVGTAGRYGLALALPVVGGWPIATLTANLLGAFLLGLLTEALVRRGPETTGLRRLRLGLGTGVLGGFTTFSSLAFEIERLVSGGTAGVATAYAAVTLLGGFLACFAGIWWAARRQAAA